VEFSITINGVTFSRNGAVVQVSTDAGSGVFSAKELHSLQEVTRLVAGMMETASAETHTVDEGVTGLEPTPEVAGAPSVRSHEGPTKLGPRALERRLSRLRSKPTTAEAVSKRNPRPSPKRQRGALVAMMLQWFAAHAGPHDLDTVVAVAKANDWTLARSVRTAVAAALRRQQAKIAKTDTGQFQLAQ